MTMRSETCSSRSSCHRNRRLLPTGRKLGGRRPNSAVNSELRYAPDIISSIAVSFPLVRPELGCAAFQKLADFPRSSSSQTRSAAPPCRRHRIPRCRTTACRHRSRHIRCRCGPARSTTTGRVFGVDLAQIALVGAHVAGGMEDDGEPHLPILPDLPAHGIDDDGLAISLRTVVQSVSSMSRIRRFMPRAPSAAGRGSRLDS